MALSRSGGTPPRLPLSNGFVCTCPAACKRARALVPTRRRCAAKAAPLPLGLIGKCSHLASDACPISGTNGRERHRRSINMSWKQGMGAARDSGARRAKDTVGNLAVRPIRMDYARHQRGRRIGRGGGCAQCRRKNLHAARGHACGAPGRHVFTAVLVFRMGRAIAAVFAGVNPVFGFNGLAIDAAALRRRSAVAC